MPVSLRPSLIRQKKIQVEPKNPKSYVKRAANPQDTKHPYHIQYPNQPEHSIILFLSSQPRTMIAYPLAHTKSHPQVALIRAYGLPLPILLLPALNPSHQGGRLVDGRTDGWGLWSGDMDIGWVGRTEG